MTSPGTVRWRIARAVGAGWLLGMPVTALLAVAVGAYAEFAGREEQTAVWSALGVAVGFGAAGGLVVLVVRLRLGRTERPEPGPLDPEADGAIVDGLRERGSWLTVAGVMVLAPVLVLWLTPSEEGGLGRRPATPSGQFDGRLGLAVAIVVGAVVVAAVGLAAAQRAERRVRDAIAETEVEVPDDVRIGLHSLRPVALLRLGATSIAAMAVVVAGVLVTPSLGGTGVLGAVAVALVVQVLGVRGVRADVEGLDALRARLV